MKARVKWGERTSSFAHPHQGQARGIKYKYIVGVEGNGVVLSPVAKQEMACEKERRDSKTEEGCRNVHKRTDCPKSSKIKKAGDMWSKRGPTGKASHALLS